LRPQLVVVGQVLEEPADVLVDLLIVFEVGQGGPSLRSGTPPAVGVGQHSGSPIPGEGPFTSSGRDAGSLRRMDVPSFDPRAPGTRRLEGRRALVTGADSGIGQGVAYELAAHG